MTGNDHERTDAPIRPLVWYAVALALITVGAMWAMAWLFGYLDARHRAADPPLSPLSEQVERPVVPQLQANPRDELLQVRRIEEKLLNEYGWVDEQGGIARIPIERAMEIVAEKGLPHRDSAPTSEGPESPER